MQESIKFSTDGTEYIPETKLPQYFCLPFPNGFKPNLILSQTLEKLAHNIEIIPVNELEDFVNKYAV